MNSRGRKPTEKGGTPSPPAGSHQLRLPTVGFTHGYLSWAAARPFLRGGVKMHLLAGRANGCCGRLVHEKGG